MVDGTLNAQASKDWVGCIQNVWRVASIDTIHGVRIHCLCCSEHNTTSTLQPYESETRRVTSHPCWLGIHVKLIINKLHYNEPCYNRPCYNEPLYDKRSYVLLISSCLGRLTCAVTNLRYDERFLYSQRIVIAKFTCLCWCYGFQWRYHWCRESLESSTLSKNISMHAAMYNKAAF